MTGNRLHHVFRARWTKSTGSGKQRRDGELVQSQGENYEALHRENSLSTSRSRSVNPAARTLLRGLNTTEYSGPNLPNCSRTVSRNRRLIRFRTTALPSARGAVKPTFGPPDPSSARQNAEKYGPVIRIPCLYTFRKSTDRRIRASFGKLNPCLLLLVGSGVTNDSLVAHRQLVASLCPPAGQYRPAIFCLHALAESMGLGPLTVVRLKCTLWHLRPSPRAGNPLRRTTILRGLTALKSSV